MDDYDRFMIDTPFPWCWHCGRGPSDRPGMWFASWLIERSHVTSNPRRLDPRAVVALCSWCHKISHGIDIVVPKETAPPAPTLPNMLWLKNMFDPRRYDRAFLERSCIGRLPRAACPPPAVQLLYRSRRGDYPHGRR
jgi:hypothetical protein